MNPSNIPTEADYDIVIPDKPAAPVRRLTMNPDFDQTDRIVAVALDGGFFYSGVNDDKKDAVEGWMNTLDNSVDLIDECLHAVTPQFESNGLENSD